MSAADMLKKQVKVLTNGRRPLDCTHIRLLSMALEGLEVPRHRRIEIINAAIEGSRALVQARRLAREEAARAPT